MPFLPVDELQRRAKLASKIAKQEAKLEDVPIYYKQNGILIKECADGKKFRLKQVGNKLEEVLLV